MNVFEDLLVELKQEKLLEDTVVTVGSQDGAKWPQNSAPSILAKPEPDSAAKNVGFDLNPSLPGKRPSSMPEQVPVHDKPRNGGEYYQKRAIAEISNLQMVEHVLTGVEREYLKVVPKTFDDFNAKKALNAFLQVEENENSDAHTESEFNLMTETEAWCTALADRDRKIFVSSLRLYCENSRPPLSSQALLSLARFYRNLPYSEDVRGKFDFLITRLFSRPSADDKRKLLLPKQEIAGHINKLYRDWSSIALYSVEEKDQTLSLTALSFDDLATEAEKCTGFDQLISSDLFGRLRTFKESVTEMFYAPAVTAAAIDANIRIGNAYVDLLGHERRKLDADSIEAKYLDLPAGDISDATARTLNLVEILRGIPEQATEPEPMDSPSGYEAPPDEVKEPQPEIRSSVPAAAEDKVIRTPSKIFSDLIGNAREVNRTFLVVCGVLIAASLGIFLYSNYFLTESASTSSVPEFSIDSPILSEHLEAAKLSGETLYGTLKPSWDVLPKEKRVEFLHKVQSYGRDKHFNQVNLTTKDGKNAAFASKTRLEVYMQ